MFCRWFDETASRKHVSRTYFVLFDIERLSIYFLLLLKTWSVLNTVWQTNLRYFRLTISFLLSQNNLFNLIFKLSSMACTVTQTSVENLLGKFRVLHLLARQRKKLKFPGQKHHHRLSAVASASRIADEVEQTYHGSDVAFFSIN